MELFFDTETTGLPLKKRSMFDDAQPYVCQLAYTLSDEDYIYGQFDALINLPETITEMPQKAYEAHHFSVSDCNEFGVPALTALLPFIKFAEIADTIVAHNIKFDSWLMMTMIGRYLDEEMAEKVFAKKVYCTMNGTKDLLRLPTSWPSSDFKWPTLSELHNYLFDCDFDNAHNARYDVAATRKCYYKLVEDGYVTC